MDLAKIKELDAKNYMTVFSRQNVCFVRGEGNKLYDTQGREYTDFTAGIAVNSLGYNHPALVNAITLQAQKLMHISNLYYNEPQIELSEALLCGSIFSRVMFVNSGAEANETAIKLTRRHFYNKECGRYKIITALNSFHGRTLATAAATGQEKYSKPFAPLPTGFVHVKYNDFDAFKNAVDDETAAVMVECVQGESGVIRAEYDYLVNVYAYCKSRGILFIADEVQTGMGRTGKMFGFEHYGIQPDIITLAKGLGGGVPIGACLAHGDVAEAFRPGDHGSTFGGNPLACAAALQVVKILKDPSFMQRITEVGDYLAAKLAKLSKYNFVLDVRGLGLMRAVALSDKLKAAEVAGKMMSKGFVVNAAGNNTLRFVPPLTITEDEIDKMADALFDIFAATNI